jgi:hypothetical protein
MKVLARVISSPTANAFNRLVLLRTRTKAETASAYQSIIDFTSSVESVGFENKRFHILVGILVHVHCLVLVRCGIRVVGHQIRRREGGPTLQRRRMDPHLPRSISGLKEDATRKKILPRSHACQSHLRYLR